MVRVLSNGKLTRDSAKEFPTAGRLDTAQADHISRFGGGLIAAVRP